MSALHLFAALPDIEFSVADEHAGRISVIQADASAACGPVLRAVVPSGPLAGPCACLVGSDALRFTYGPGSVCLGSAQGWLPIIGRRFGAAVLNSDDPRHAAERRQWTPAFATRALAQCVPAMDAVIARRIAKWTDAGDIDAYAAARELAFAAIGSAAGGLRDDVALTELGSHFADVLAGPRSGETPARYHVRVLPLRDAIEHRLIECIEAARRLRDSPSTAGLLALLLEQDPSADTASLLHAMNILLIAGHETSASLLAWILLLAADDPVWLKRLAGEADALPMHPIAIDVGVLTRMPAHDAFIAEAGRVHPPLVNAPRMAMRDFDYAGVQIAAGTTIALAIGATHRSRDTYADPNAFRPERFLADRTAKAAELFTFGHGARSCLGMRFAQLAMKLTMIRLLQVAVPVRAGAPASVHAGFWNARPRGNLRMRLEPR